MIDAFPGELTMSEPTSEYEQERRAKLNALRESGVDPFGSRTDGIRPLSDIKCLYKPEMGHDAGPAVVGAGRVMLKRDMGKLSFLTLRDDSGDLQVALDKRRLSDGDWKVRDAIDLGDFIVVHGTLGVTKKAKSPSGLPKSPWPPRRCFPRPASGMASPMSNFAIASATSISGPIQRSCG